MMAFPVVDEKIGILLTVADAGPVTTSKDQTVVSFKALFVKENIGSFPYVGKVAQLNILSAVLEFVDPDSVPTLVMLFVPIAKAPLIVSPAFVTFKANPAFNAVLVAKSDINVPEL